MVLKIFFEKRFYGNVGEILGNFFDLFPSSREVWEGVKNVKKLSTWFIDDPRIVF